MQCTQLIRLVKGWYINVKDETMAPARMMQFIDKHIKNCDTCLQDEGLMAEIEKIRELVLPESKIPKSVRDTEGQATPEISPDGDEDNNADGDGDGDDENDDDDDGDDDNVDDNDDDDDGDDDDNVDDNNVDDNDDDDDDYE